MSRPMSLRAKLVASILALFVLLSLATGAATVFALQRSVMAQLDRQVTSNAEGPGGAGGPGGLGNGRFRPIDTDDCSTDSNGRARRGEGLYVTVTSDGAIGQGCVVGASRTITTLTSGQVATLTGAGLGTTPQSVELGGTLGTYRAVAQRTITGGTYITGATQERAQQTVNQLILVSTAFGLVGLGLVGAGGWWLVGANLRPLQRVAKTANRVATLPLSSGAVDLADERVPAADTDRRTEVGQVGAALNELLDHVDTSLQARHASETQLRQFVADASHELRTPLASIKGYAELSRREKSPVPDTITHALGRIESEAGRMGSLVEDLLLLARLDAGRPLEREPVDLTMLTIDAVSDLRVAGPDHQWRLDLPDEAVEAVGDRARLTQIVINLLNNARVHTPPGTTVTARVRAVGGVAEIQVQDDGQGIDPDLLPKVFGRFTRADEARNRNKGSTGLGLSIVAAVAQAHGGQVGVSSRPGETIFTVRLPMSGPPLVNPPQG